MILTIICIAVVIISAILFIKFLCNNSKKYDVPGIVAAILLIPSLVIAIIGSLLGICNTVDYELEHAEAIEERHTICYRLEQQKNVDDIEKSYIINGGVYNDVVEFNAKVRRDNKFGKNPWVNWFNGWAYADIEEIPVVDYLTGSD